MHVSRVAALLLRAVRRSRRPLAITLVASIVAGICVVAGLSSTAMAAEQPTGASTDAKATDVSGGGEATNVTSTSGSSTSTPAPSADSSSSSGGSSGASTGSSKPTPKATVKSKPVVVQKSTPVNKPMLAPVLTLDGVTTVADTNHDGRPSVGDIATTAWKVKNTGATQATALTIAVNRGSGTCTPTTVDSGASSNCTTTTTLKQSDLDAAKITITGTATATISGSPSSSAEGVAPLALKVVSGLQLSQRIFRLSDRDHNGRTSKGDLVEFVFTVTNTGSQTVHGLVIFDAKATTAHVSITCATTTLAPRHSTTCRSGGYTVTGGQAKLGVLTNTGRARATTPTGNHILSPVSIVSIGVLKPPPPIRPHLALRIYVASIGGAGPSAHIAAGDTISFGFVISNTGNARISGLTITDPKLDLAKIAIHCGSSSLSSGASTRCTSAPMTITTFSVAQQNLTDFANVHGTASNGARVAAYDKITIGLSGNIHALVGSSGIRALPRTGGINTTPLTLGFWMVLIGLGLVVAGRRPGRPATAAIAPDRRSWVSSRAIR